MGPDTAELVLEQRAGPKAEALPNQIGEVALSCGAGVIVIYRPDCYSASITCRQVLMMTMSYLKADCSPALDIVGDLAALKGSGDGPPPPPGDVVNVVACSVRLSANWDQSDALFAGLISGADSVMKIPLERFDYEVYYNPDVSTMEPYQMNTRHTSYVEGAELFDNRQFEISNAEAAGMDVRQRHVLECGADLLFQIGITKKSANRQVGSWEKSS